MTLMTSLVACRAILNGSSRTTCCKPLRHFPIQGSTFLNFLSMRIQNHQGLHF